MFSGIVKVDAVNVGRGCPTCASVSGKNPAYKNINSLQTIISKEVVNKDKK
jgi:hypothetical protein